MELLQKISKKYLSLSFSMLMTIVMALGVVSCDCGDKSEEGTTGKPSISFENGELMGDANKTTNFKVEGSSYKAGDFEIQANVKGGSIKIGDVTFTDGEAKKSLNEVLGVNADEEVKEDKTISVEVTPADSKVPLEVTVKLIDKDGSEVGNPALLTWKPKPEVTTGLVVTISELAGDKITVKVEAKKDGNKVNVKAEDLKDVKMEVTSTQNQTETATIVEALEFKEADIQAGVINKEFTVKKGIKDTELTITVTKGVNNKLDERKINVPAVAGYTFEFNPKKIEDGTTEVTINLKKNNENLVQTEVDKLKFHVEYTEGVDVTIGGKKQGENIEFTPGNLAVDGGKKFATTKLTIDPKKNKSAKFELQLVDEQSAKHGTKQTLEWGNGIDLVVDAVHDLKSKLVKVTVKNNGKKAEVDGLKLTFKRTKGAEALLNTKDSDDNIVVGKVTSTMPHALDLAIEFKADKNAEFEFTLFDQAGEKVFEKKFAYTITECKVAITAISDNVKGGGQVKLKFKNNSGIDLEEAELKTITIKYGSTNSGKLHNAGGEISVQTLWDILGAPLAGKAETEKEFDVVGNTKAKVEFTDIELTGSTDGTKKVGKIDWEAANKVAITATSDNVKGGGQVKLKFKNNSGVDLEEAELKTITIKYGSTNSSKLHNIGGEISVQTLWDILGAPLADKAETEKEFDVVGNTKAKVEFTDIELTGSTDGTKKVGKIDWEAANKVAITATSDNVKGGGQVKLKFKNSSGIDLEEAELKTITIKYGSTNSGKLHNAGGEISVQTLWDILGAPLADKAETEKEFDVVGNTKAKVEFTDIKLIGSTDVQNKVGKIDWEGELKVKIEGGVVDMGAKTVTFKLTNNSGFILDEAGLKAIKLEYTTTKGSLKKGIEVAAGKTLWELLGSAIDATPVDLVLTIDNDGAASVEFTKVKLNGSTDTNEIASVKWKSVPNVKIGGGVVDMGAKTVTFTLTNMTGLKLNRAELETITLDYAAANAKGSLKKGGLIGGGTEARGKSLWKLLGKTIDDATPVDLELDIDNDGAAGIIFTQIKLVGSPDKSEINRVEWIGIKAKDVKITTPKKDTETIHQKGTYLVKFQATKEGINTEWLTVTVTTTNNVTFKDTNGSAINWVDTKLSDLARVGSKVLNTTDEVELVDLQVDDEKSQADSVVTFIIKYKGVEIAKRSIKWTNA